MLRNMIMGLMLGIFMVGSPIIGNAQDDITSLPTPTPLVRPVPVLAIKKTCKKKPKSKVVSKVLNNRFFKHLYDTGIASFYGLDFQGSRTASGTPFNTYAKMCAMRYVPLNTTVVVKNLRTGLSTTCKVLDRGPFVPGRIIDLSIAAAHAIGFNGLEAVAIYV